MPQAKASRCAGKVFPSVIQIIAFGDWEGIALRAI